MSPRTAVLLPVYRDQGGLDRSLDSLRLAACSFDVVIVDDGSPEPISAPPRLREDVQVVLIRLPQNLGIAGALNVGLRHILERCYTYVGRLDAGDKVAPERFERQADFMDLHPTCGVVSSVVDFVDANDTVLFRFSAPNDHRTILRKLHLNNCIMHPASMIRVEALRKLGIYREDVPGAEDYELFLRMSRSYTLAVIPETLTHMEYNTRGLSVAGRRRQQRTRLRLQLRYFDPLAAYSFLGVVRTLVAMLIPQSVVIGFKRASTR